MMGWKPFGLEDENFSTNATLKVQPKSIRIEHKHILGGLENHDEITIKEMEFKVKEDWSHVYSSAASNKF